MQLPKLKPLQSRLLASALTTCLVIALCAGFEPHNLVYAAEAPVQSGGDSNLVESIPLALPDVPVIERRGNEAEERSDGVYATDFAYFDRSVVGRQQEEVKQLADNQKEEASAAPNSTQFYRFKPDQPKSNSARAVLDDALEENNTLERILIKEEDADTNDGETVIEKRQNSRRVWISANACSGPLPNVTLITGETPQLTLYVSTSANNQKPGPRTPDTTAVPFVQGFANLTLQTGNEIYMGVSAPDLTAGWNGGWSYEIAASVEGQYHNYANNSQFIYMVDTDSESALFITHNFTDSNSADEVKKWTDQNRFDMYAFPAANWSNMKGLEASYCGLKKQFDAGGITVNKSITTIFGNGLPAGQFHIAGLKNSTKYTGFLTLAGSESETMDIPDIGTVRAGGQVFQQFQWTTKADDSCQVIFDLEFCADIAYAVPSSPQYKFNDTGLKTLYDNQAKALYQNFSNSLAQIACDTASTAQYSLARTCDDCRRDYKTWLCSVLIPRCEDFTATDPWLMTRNVNTPFADGSLPSSNNLTQTYNATYRERFAYNQSRNPMIDQDIQPGPYKELLPCTDLCYDLVRSCPAALKFGCPKSPALELSYGRREEHNLTCNFPGAVVDLSPLRGGVGIVMANIVFAVVSAVFVGGILEWV